MELTGTQVISASRDAVWDALTDPAVLKACLPGCESVESSSPEEFRVIVATAIGPLRARFRGVLRMTQTQRPQSCVMVFEGQGGAIGFGKGSSSVTLGEVPDGTELRYSANAQLGGKLAQIGSRMIDGVARKMADDFFAALSNVIAPTTQGPSDSGRVSAPASAADPKRTSAPDLVDSRPSEPVASIAPDAPATALAAPGQGSIMQRPSSESMASSTIMVPGWWLAIASVLGALTAIGSVLLLR